MKVLLWLTGKQPLAICDFLYNFAQKFLRLFLTIESGIRMKLRSHGNPMFQVKFPVR